LEVLTVKCILTSKFHLTNKTDAFKFIFRLYNFFDWSKTASMFRPDSCHVLSFVGKMADIPTTESNTGGDNSSRSRKTKLSKTARGATPGDRTWTLFQIAQKEGYNLLTFINRDKRSTVAKAYKNDHIVAMKLITGRRRPLANSSQSEELRIIMDLQKLDSPRNHTIKVLHVYHFHHHPSDKSDDIIVMPWQSPLDDFLIGFPTMAESLWHQFLEGVSFLHEHGIAHLDLKPGNVLVGYSDKPRLALIDFGISVLAKSKEIMVEGYRGTPLWSAPEVGTEDGPKMRYSPILADRWSCGRVLRHIRDFHPINDTSVFVSVQEELLSPVPSARPSLAHVHRRFQTPSAKRCDVDSGFVSQKRLRSAGWYVYFFYLVASVYM
jgi:serine/threonine protein kinase